MNTPAHSILSLVCLDRGRFQGQGLPIFVGSLVPDAPILLFYLYEKIAYQTPEVLIWSTRYFQPGWQLLFDLFNSIPLALALVAVALSFRAWGWAAFGSSVVLHCLGDLPVHHDDAHRHFLPLTGWRFESPVSYWDPQYYGQYFALFEIAFVAIGSVTLWRRYDSRWARALVGLIGVTYAAYLVFVVVVWM